MNHTRQKISYQYVNYSSLLPTQLQWLTSTKILQGLYMRSAIKNANTTRFGLNIKSSNEYCRQLNIISSRRLPLRHLSTNSTFNREVHIKTTKKRSNI
jgi:hypothetical protein